MYPRKCYFFHKSQKLESTNWSGFIVLRFEKTNEYAMNMNEWRRAWIYQRGNQNPYIEEQSKQWPTENVQKDKQRSTTHAHKTKDQETRIPLKFVGEIRFSGSQMIEKSEIITSQKNATMMHWNMHMLSVPWNVNNLICVTQINQSSPRALASFSNLSISIVEIRHIKYLQLLKVF